ncbi:MAG TPA: hypothetical protein VF247_09415 [Candidatus Krumholzibacteria bacterium]
MKRFCIAALVALAGITAITPSAHAIGVMASWWNIDEANQDGFGFGLRQKTQIVPLISIDTRASWIKFSDADLQVFPIEVTGMVRLGMLYAGLGGGYYIFDADQGDLDNNFGWYLVGGIDISVSKFGVFGEVKWTQLSADYKDVDPNLSDVPTSLEADGIGFNLGVMFGVPGM